MRMVVEEKKRFQTCEITAFLYSAEASLTMAGQLNGLIRVPPSLWFALPCREDCVFLGSSV